MGIHKYGPDTSSSQLGIKCLGTRVSRADRYGSRSSDSLSSGFTVVYQNVGMWLPRKRMGIGFRPLHVLYIFMLCAT